MARLARPQIRERAFRTGAANRKREKIMEEKLQNELEAAVFRRLVAHLRKRSDVQNIDLMELAGFCRNCLSNWYQEAAAERGITISKEAAKEIVYGMPYEEWKDKFQTESPRRR
jgi:uncharacterized protein